MPLIKSPSQKAFKANVRAEINAKKPRDQALAIAYRIQREAKAMGGGVRAIPKLMKSNETGAERYGYINGSTGGRADRVPAKVRANSYVIPSDIVSSIGQGNSIAGAQALYKLFGMGPYGSPQIKTPSKRSRFSDGGAAVTPVTEVVVSDGEFNVPPDKIAELGEGDIKRGHAVLDEFVKHVRQKTIKTLKSLPGPKNS